MTINYLATKFVVLFCAAALLQPEPASAAIGDITHVINAPFNTIGDNFAYDRAANQFHGRDSSSISVLDSDGLIVKQGTISSSQRDDLNALAARGFLVEDSNTWVGLGQNFLTRWQLNEDQNDELFLSEVGQTDLNHLLDINRNEQLIDMTMAPDGSLIFYGTRSGPNEVFLLHTSADGVSEIERVPLHDQPFYGFGRPATTGSTMLGVDPSGNLLLRGLGFRPPSPNLPMSNNEYGDYWYFVARNGAKLSLLGRIEYSTTNEISVGDGVLFRQYGNEITGFELSEAPLPKLNNISFDPKGVLWDNGCATGAEDLNTESTMSVDWAGVSGRVLVSIDGTTQTPSFPSLRFMSNDWTDVEVDGSNVTMPYSIDGFKLSQNPNPTLWIEVMNQDGQTSGLIETASEIAAYRGSLFGLAFEFANPCPLISYEQANQVGKWSAGGRWPAVPLKGTITFPSFFPFVGGDSFGISDLSAELSGAIASDGEEKMVLSGGGAFAIGPGEIGMRLGGGATTKLNPNTIEYPGGIASLAISGALKKEIGLLDAFPLAKPSLEYFNLKSVLELVNRIAKLEGIVSVQGQSTFKMAAHPVDGSLSLDGENEYALALIANAHTNLAGDFIEVSAYGEGRTAVTVGQSKAVATDMELRKIALRFLLSAKIKFWGAVKEFAQPYVWESDFTQRVSAKLLSPVPDSGWQYRYGNKQGKGAKSIVGLPAVMSGNPYLSDTKPLASGLKEGPAQNQASGEELAQFHALGDDTARTLMTDVAAGAKPQAAMAPDGTAMVVWEQEVAGLPSTQATDIYFSYFDGNRYSTPAAVNSDSMADFTPTVAYHHTGVWIALWEQVNLDDLVPTGDPLADAETQISYLVPAYSIFDPATNAWTTPFQLAETGTHFNTQLATGPSNDVTAMWIHDPLQRLVPYDFGDPDAAPPSATVKNEILYTRFSSGDFEPVREAQMGPNIMFLDFTAADSGQEIAVAAVRLVAADFDPGLKANADLLIGVNVISSGGNSFFTQYGNQNGLNRSVRLGPKLRAMDDGSWRLAWKQFDGAFYDPRHPSLRISDDLSNFPADHRVLIRDSFGDETPYSEVTGNRGSRWNNATLGDAGGGNAYVILPDYSSDQSTLSLVFDDVAGLPSGVLNLDLDDAMEKSVSVDSSPDGSLLVTYLKTEAIKSETMVDEGGGDFEPYIQVRESDTGAVTVLSHNIFTDLVVDEVDIVGGLVKAGFDTIIEATIHNRGDLSVTDPRVSVFIRPLGSVTNRAADIKIANNLLVVDGLMAGHSKASVQIPWTVPSDGNYAAYAVVDPNNDIVEAFENNNDQQPQVLGKVFDNVFISGFEN